MKKEIKKQDSLADIQAKAKRVQSDALFAMIYMVGCGYITKEFARDIGIIDLEGVIKLIHEEHPIEWIRFTTKKSEGVAFVIDGKSQCSACGKYGVSEDGMSDCSECRTFQISRSTTSRGAALSRMRRDKIEESEVTYVYGPLDEFEWGDLV